MMVFHERVFRLADLFYRLAKAQPIVMYHGTSIAKLPSILSQGLIPFPKERVWNEEIGDATKPAAKSIGGIYLTSNLDIALNANPVKGVAGVIIVEAMPNALAADEEEFRFLGTDLLGATSALGLELEPSNTLSEVQVYMDWLLHGETGNIFHAAQTAYVADNISLIEHKAAYLGSGSGKNPSKVLHPALLARLKQILKDGFIHALRRVVAYASDQAWRKAWEDANRNLQGEKTQLPPKPNKGEAEKGYSAFVDQLSRTIKRHHTDQRAHTDLARSLIPIGFTGNHKIVAALAVELPTKWVASLTDYVEGRRDEKGNRIFQAKVLYPSSWSKVPEAARADFIRQWKQNSSSKIEFDPA
jgi:hypothetical protein